MIAEYRTNNSQVKFGRCASQLDETSYQIVRKKVESWHFFVARETCFSISIELVFDRIHDNDMRHPSKVALGGIKLGWPLRRPARSVNIWNDEHDSATKVARPTFFT